MGAQAVTFNRDNKFDLQLSAALINERKLGEIFSTGRIEKIELRSGWDAWGFEVQPSEAAE